MHSSNPRPICATQIALILTRKQGDRYYRAALHGFPDEAIAEMKSVPVDLESGMIVARALRNCAVVHVADVNADPEYPGSPAQTLGGVRTVLSVPLIRETQPIGAITVSRTRVEPFTEKQIDLIKTFADQAVIAIENARLFDEVTARTEDLRESLQQQTATADVLKVISRSAFDLQTVLDTLVQSAARLADAANCFIFRREGDKFRLASSHGFTPEYRECDGAANPSSPAGIARWANSAPRPHGAHPGRAGGRGLYVAANRSSAGNFRTMLGVPLMREGVPIGVIAAVRPVSKPFTEKQIELVSTFADQAVIAIENVRLFDEVQAKTRDLTEALTYQTGSGNILSVIASSPTDVEPVLKAIVESACELCDAYDAVVILKEGDDLAGSAPITAQSDESAALAERSQLGRRAGDGRPASRCTSTTCWPRGRICAGAGNVASHGYRTHPQRTPAAGGRSDRRDCASPRRGSSVHREADRSAADLCRPGSDRNRKCPAVRRGPGAYARPHRVAAAADRDRGSPCLISGSMHDSKPVFEAIVRNLLRLLWNPICSGPDAWRRRRRYARRRWPARF